jgi:type VI secretion system protein ImpF
MSKFFPGFFEKLIGDGGRLLSQSHVRLLSLEELKDEVAKDLELLLNTRAVFRLDDLKKHPECAASIINYGLQDFAGMSLVSTDDRASICRNLEQSIARHEPRLKSVRASLELQDGQINRLSFSISALLVVSATQEPVSFDAVLQPSSLQYSIKKSRHIARIGI